MNGKKGPNQVGRDMGFFAVEGSGVPAVASVALPLTEFGRFLNGATSGSKSTWQQAVKFCEDNQAILPNVHELTSMAMAYQLATPSVDFFWSGSPASGSNLWIVYLFLNYGGRTYSSPDTNYAVRCLRR